MQKTIMPDIINNAIESSNKLSNNLSKIINSYNFDNLMNIAVSSKLQTTLQELTKVIKTFHVGDLSGYETEYLKNNFWVLPYDIEYKDINSLTSLSNEEFNAKMLEHFTNDRINNLVVNLMMLNAEIMFIGLFGTANYFARLANYFLIFQTLAVPYLFQFFNRGSRRVFKLGSLTGYSLYFFYAEGIAIGGFDLMFNRITILEYLQTFFS